MSTNYRVIPEELFVILVERGIITPEIFNNSASQPILIDANKDPDAKEKAKSAESEIVKKWIPFDQVFTFKKIVKKWMSDTLKEDIWILGLQGL